jgi:hypothetical protein
MICSMYRKEIPKDQPGKGRGKVSQKSKGKKGK